MIKNSKMSIPNKQIGWSQESNLLWEILSKLQRLTGVLSTGGGGSSSYKVYTARLTQTGATAPVPTVFENTTGVNITYTYSSPGIYIINLPGVDMSKLWIVMNNNTTFQTGNIALNTLDYQVGTVSIYSINASNLQRENAYAVPNIIDIEIRIYN